MALPGEGSELVKRQPLHPNGKTYPYEHIIFIDYNNDVTNMHMQYAYVCLCSIMSRWKRWKMAVLLMTFM